MPSSSASRSLDKFTMPHVPGDAVSKSASWEPFSASASNSPAAKLSGPLRRSSSAHSNCSSPTVSRSLGLTPLAIPRPDATPSAASTATPNVQEFHGSDDEEGIETFQVKSYSHQTTVTVRWLPDQEIAFAGMLELESPLQALRECIAEATGITFSSQLLLAKGKLIKGDNESLHSVLDTDVCECFLMRMPTVEAKRQSLSCPLQAFATLRGDSWEPMVTLIDSQDGSVVYTSMLPEADGGLEGFAFSDTCARLEFCTSEGQHYLDLDDMTLHLKLDEEPFSERV